MHPLVWWPCPLFTILASSVGCHAVTTHSTLRDFECSCLFRARIGQHALSFFGVCWGATCLAGLTGQTTGRSVMLWSDHSSQTVSRDSAATFVDDFDQSGHGWLPCMMRDATQESLCRSSWNLSLLQYHHKLVCLKVGTITFVRYLETQNCGRFRHSTRLTSMSVSGAR